MFPEATDSLHPRMSPEPRRCRPRALQGTLEDHLDWSTVRTSQVCGFWAADGWIQPHLYTQVPLTLKHLVPSLVFASQIQNVPKSEAFWACCQWSKRSCGVKPIRTTQLGLGTGPTVPEITQNHPTFWSWAAFLSLGLSIASIFWINPLSDCDLQVSSPHLWLLLAFSPQCLCREVLSLCSVQFIFFPCYGSCLWVHI
jgi:hypothetical protein